MALIELMPMSQHKLAGRVSNDNVEESITQRRIRRPYLDQRVYMGEQPYNSVKLQDRHGYHFAFNLVGKLGPWLIEFGRNLLFDALMGTVLIEILNICRYDAFELVLVEDEEVIEALSF